MSAEFDKGPTCIRTKCQGYKCSVLLPSGAQLRFLPIDKQAKLSRWLLDDFVSRHAKDYRWCPFSNCVMSAQRVDGVAHVGGIDCTCSHAWCFECGLEDHRPASCDDAKKWHDKNNSDAENVNWILANTKVCPKCGVNIEKNQGCNHVRTGDKQQQQRVHGGMPFSFSCPLIPPGSRVCVGALFLFQMSSSDDNARMCLACDSWAHSSSSFFSLLFPFSSLPQVHARILVRNHSAPAPALKRRAPAPHPHRRSLTCFAVGSPAPSLPCLSPAVSCSWLCKGDWSGHSSCANFSASGAAAASKETRAVENAQNALKKYMHYWSRFDNHAKSIKFAEKTRRAAEERMEQLQALKGTNLLDVQFIVDSVNAVIQNKRILQWLYVYAVSRNTSRARSVTDFRGSLCLALFFHFFSITSRHRRAAVIAPSSSCIRRSWRSLRTSSTV